MSCFFGCNCCGYNHNCGCNGNNSGVGGDSTTNNNCVCKCYCTCGSNTANTAGASVNNGCYTCLQPSNVTLTSNTTNSCGCQS